MTALLLLASGLLVALGVAFSPSVPATLLLLAFMSMLWGAYLYTAHAMFLIRSVCRIVANTLYRLKHEGREHIPADGPCVLVCNHVTFIDWLIISGVCKRPIRFVMHYKFLDLPLAGPLLRDANVIPIASARESEDVLKAALDRVAEELADGQVVCIFPEGRLTPDGSLQQFRRGIEHILERTPVPVVPMSLHGMWGSAFSRKHTDLHQRFFHRFWSKIRVVIAEPIPPEQVTADALSARVEALLPAGA